jgi:hypothetical protein
MAQEIIIDMASDHPKLELGLKFIDKPLWFFFPMQQNDSHFSGLQIPQEPSIFEMMIVPKHPFPFVVVSIEQD